MMNVGVGGLKEDLHAVQGSDDSFGDTASHTTGDETAKHVLLALVIHIGRCGVTYACLLRELLFDGTVHVR
jgi:hypothetical protein